MQAALILEYLFACVFFKNASLLELMHQLGP